MVQIKLKRSEFKSIASDNLRKYRLWLRNLCHWNYTAECSGVELVSTITIATSRLDCFCLTFLIRNVLECRIKKDLNRGLFRGKHDFRNNTLSYIFSQDVLYTESNQTVLLLCGTFVSSQSLIKRCFKQDEKCNVCRLAEINVIFNLSRCPILKCEIALLNVRCDSYYKCVEIHLPPCLLSSLSLSLSLSWVLDEQALFIQSLSL